MASDRTSSDMLEVDGEVGSVLQLYHVSLSLSNRDGRNHEIH